MREGAGSLRRLPPALPAPRGKAQAPSSPAATGGPAPTTQTAASTEGGGRGRRGLLATALSGLPAAAPCRPHPPPDRRERPRPPSTAFGTPLHLHHLAVSVLRPFFCGFLTKKQAPTTGRCTSAHGSSPSSCIFTVASCQLQKKKKIPVLWLVVSISIEETFVRVGWRLS